MIYKKFAIEIGRRLDVNYIEFCKMVDKFAQNRWDKVYSQVYRIHVSEIAQHVVNLYNCYWLHVLFGSYDAIPLLIQ